MRNLPSALMCIVFVYMNYTYGFHWIFLILIAGAIAFWEIHTKEGIELIKAQIRNLDAGTESLKMAKMANQSTAQVNLRTLETINMMRRKMGL